jgi:hypothetical protein
MKRLLITSAASLAASTALFAQTLTVSAPGYAGVKLFDSTAGFTITGMGADAAGSVYYLETDGASSTNTRLYKRSSADGYASATPLFDYGSVLYGSFVVAQAGRIYFGENSTGTIRSINPDGTGAALIGTVTGNYDLAFSGGSAFVSANADTTFLNPKNKVLSLDLGTGATATMLDATPDYSGPLEFDSAGDLLYGVAKVSIGGIYRYTPADLAGAPLTLTPPDHRLLANGANQYLAFSGGSTLWQDDFTTLRTYDTVTLAAQTIATTSETFGLLDYESGALYASVTDFGASRSSVFAVTPEPSSALLLAAGMPWIFRRRRERAGKCGAR